MIPLDIPSLVLQWFLEYMAWTQRPPRMDPSFTEWTQQPHRMDSSNPLHLPSAF
jgi:hypothetical protein